MQNEERTPEFVALPDRADPLEGPRAAPARAAAASPFNFTPSMALGLAAGLLLLAALALYLFWHAALLLRSPAAPAPLRGEEARPGSRAAAAPMPAGAVLAESLTPPSGGPEEADLAPPAPGLLMAPISLENVSYNGPSPAPAALAEETAGDRAGCKTGDMLKCLRLGGRYLAGYGVERDAERAFPFINRACAGGIAEACTTQGIMQLAGHGTARDVPGAVALFDKACGAGDMYGCTMMGDTYLEGKAVPADIPRGLGLIEKACGAKLPQACTLLGMFYAEGAYVPRDRAAAERLLGEGCDLRDRNACQLLQQLRTHAAAGDKR